MDFLVQLAIIAAIAGALWLVTLWRRKTGAIPPPKPGTAGADDRARDEALFRSMFPELQPFFHPRKLVQYVGRRRGQKPPEQGRDWERPPGFEGAASAEIRYVGGRERVRLLDGARAMLAEFFYEDVAEGGVLRVGKGKLTVDLRDRAQPRVRYWHPDGEFKWKNGLWTFTTRVADQPFESRDSSVGFSRDSDSSPLAPAAAAFIGGGGTFDGGGASQGWDSAPADPGSSGDGGQAATGESDGGSSTTSY